MARAFIITTRQAPIDFISVRLTCTPHSYRPLYSRWLGKGNTIPCLCVFETRRLVELLGRQDKEAAQKCPRELRMDTNPGSKAMGFPCLEFWDELGDCLALGH